MLTGCAGKPAADNKPATENYPLPSIPAEITDPAERASVAVAHFWDGATVNVEADSVTPALEQAMSNFLAIAAMGAAPDSIGKGVGVILSKGGEGLIMPLAEHYLYDPNSPMRSEELFLLFLDRAPQWERTEALREQIMKNRVGTPAADFRYVDAKGRQGSLAEFVGKHGGAFVYFFDSECNVCKSMIPSAAEAAGSKAVLAVCPEANAKKFSETLELFPADWTVVRDLGEIDGEDLYIFPALPSVYVIAPDMTVLAKDLPI